MPTISTPTELAAQWLNPSDVSTILFVVGGDIIQKAFSQGTGKLYVPVCFSFGCAAYAFLALVGILGDGRLLSPPDYPCKVLNLRSGYLRDSKNFVLGRLLRDMEASETRQDNKDEDEGDYAMKISIFEAKWNKNDLTQFSWSYIHWVGAIVTIIQLVIAIIPTILNRSWNVVFITALGTFLVQWTGNLPQWTAEKLPNRQRSPEVFALTTGNGSRDVIVIIGYGRCLDLESLATMPSPRSSRPWEKFWSFSRPQKTAPDSQATPRRNTMLRRTKRCQLWPLRGLPSGFFITQISTALIAVAWLLLLINVSASSSVPETWCLLAIGGLGMFQNAWLAAAEIPPAARNMPLVRVDVIRGNKVMNAIMDFHVTYGLGRPLLKEFFPGELRESEDAWWKGNYDEYEDKRERLRQQSAKKASRHRDDDEKHSRRFFAIHRGKEDDVEQHSRDHMEEQQTKGDVGGEGTLTYPEKPSRWKDPEGVPRFVYPLPELKPLEEEDDFRR